jgi:hypothetical protein
MHAAQEYRQQAKKFQERADRANEPRVKAIMSQLAREYTRAAHQTERRERILKTLKHDFSS